MVPRVLQRMKNELCREHWNHKKTYFHDHQELVYCCAFNLLFAQNTFLTKVNSIQGAFKNIPGLLWKIQGLFKDFPTVFQFGYSRKNPHPHDGRHSFFTPPPPIHLDFQNCLSPAPLRISKFKDTVILFYTQYWRILLGTLVIFLLNKSQFSVNSVFVVNVVIPFSHLVK